ncbi:hypothetical protein TNCV_3374641 [Trichonephila clavipes]|nr:hypothetical protein TNCV_3374641 [Trichonephila clavipes]
MVSKSVDRATNNIIVMSCRFVSKKNGIRYESPFRRTVITPVGAPVAWRPHIIDTADTMVATPLPGYQTYETQRFSRILHDGMLAVLYETPLIHRNCSAIDLACTFTRSLDNRKCLVHGCRVTGVSPEASHYG